VNTLFSRKVTFTALTLIFHRSKNSPGSLFDMRLRSKVAFDSEKEDLTWIELKR